MVVNIIKFTFYYHRYSHYSLRLLFTRNHRSEDFALMLSSFLVWIRRAGQIFICSHHVDTKNRTNVALARARSWNRPIPRERSKFSVFCSSVKLLETKIDIKLFLKTLRIITGSHVLTQMLHIQCFISFLSQFTDDDVKTLFNSQSHPSFRVDIDTVISHIIPLSEFEQVSIRSSLLCSREIPPVVNMTPSPSLTWLYMAVTWIDSY